MHFLANYIMKGRLQAIVVILSCLIFQPLFWIAIAACCLIVMRYGLSNAFSVISWGVLPAGVWLYLGDPSIALILMGAVFLSVILSEKMSWNYVLSISVVLGIIFILLLNTISTTIIESLTETVSTILIDQDQVTIRETVIALMAASFQMLSLLCLILGRYWQSVLYNSGGFGREFRKIKFPISASILLFFGVLITPSLDTPLSMLAPVLMMPLLFATISLIHDVVKKKNISVFWLILFYLLVFLLGNILCIIAVLDSIFDFRERLKLKK